MNLSNSMPSHGWIRSAVAGTVVNTALVEGTAASDHSVVQDSDPATLIFIGEARSVPVMSRTGLMMILISLLAVLALTAVRGRI